MSTMSPEEINARMQALLTLDGYGGIIRESDNVAYWRMTSEDSLWIDVTFPDSSFWEYKRKGQKIEWQSGLGVPAQIKGMIETLDSDIMNVWGTMEWGKNGVEEVKEVIEMKEEVEEVVSEPVEDVDKLAMLDAIMDGKVEPEKPVLKVKTPVKRERQVQKMPAVIPADMRSIQIKELTIEDITNYICPAATESEAFMFLKLCQARNLNPFLNEAYLIKYGDKATMTVGKEAFMRRAEAHPQFDGYEAGIIIQNSDKTLERREGTFMLKSETLVGGWAKIYRKDRKQPFVSEVALHEYNTGKSLWVTKQATMIRKVALVQGKREAFPSEFSGMYDASEMAEGGVIEAVYQEAEV